MFTPTSLLLSQLPNYLDIAHEHSETLAGILPGNTDTLTLCRSLWCTWRPYNGTLTWNMDGYGTHLVYSVPRNSTCTTLTWRSYSLVALSYHHCIGLGCTWRPYKWRPQHGILNGQLHTYFCSQVIVAPLLLRVVIQVVPPWAPQH